MKLTPQEIKIDRNFQPSVISKNGFLGNDTRHVHDIIRADQMTLSRLGVTCEEIADRLQYFIDQAQANIEGSVDLGDYVVKIFWTKGMLTCPFGEPELHAKTVVTIIIKELNVQITFSQLNVHLIRAHGFFQGKGSTFRIEPEEIVKILNIV